MPAAWWEGALVGALAVAGLLVLRGPLRRWAGSGAVAWLWVLVAVRLLVPWVPEAKWGALRHGAAPEVERRVSVVAAPVVEQAPVGSEAPVPAPAPAGWGVGEWAFAVWLGGAVVGLGLVALRARHAARLRAGAVACEDARLLAVWESLPTRWRRGVALGRHDALAAPVLCGLWRPRILLPQAWVEGADAGELRHVLLHELGHARRGDLWVEVFFLGARALYWWHPLIWIAAWQARQERELACDDWALSRLGPEAAPAYGETLLKTARLVAGQRVGLGMADGGHNLRGRVRAIAVFTPRAAWRGAVGVAAGALLLGLATTRATPPPPLAIGEPKEVAIGEPEEVAVQVRMLEMPPDAAQELEAEVARLGGKKGVLNEAQAEALLKKLNRMKGVDLLSMPTVSLRRYRVSVEITRELRYPVSPGKEGGTPAVYETRNTGASADIEREKEGTLRVKAEWTEFEGFAQQGEGELPLPKFSTRRAEYGGLPAQPGASIVLRLPKEGAEERHRWLWVSMLAPTVFDGVETVKRYFQISARVVDLQDATVGQMEAAFGKRGPGPFVLTAEELARAEQRFPSGGAVIDFGSANTMPGNEALFEGVREFNYPTKYRDAAADASGEVLPPVPTHFEMRKLGIGLRAIASGGEGGAPVTLQMEASWTHLAGYTALSTGEYTALPLGGGVGSERYRRLQQMKPPFIPKFLVQRAEAQAEMRSGETLVYGDLRPEEKRATWYLLEVNEVFNRTPMPSAKPENHWMTDPDAPDAGKIDVTGYPSGTEIVSPYTGKVLRVP